MGSKSATAATIVFQHFHLMPTPQRWRRGANRTPNQLLALEDIAFSRKQPKNLIFDVLVMLNSWIYHRSNTLLSARSVPVLLSLLSSVTQHMCARIESGQSLSCLFIAAPFFTSSFNGSLQSFVLRKPRKLSNEADTETPTWTKMKVIAVPKPMFVDQELSGTSSLVTTYNQPRPASFLPSLAALSRPQFPTFDPRKVHNASSVEAIPKNFTQTPNSARDKSSSPAILQA